MIILRASTVEDVELIQRWTDADEYHKGQNNPAWWLTGQGLLSFALVDEQGPLCFVRLDLNESMVRLNTQFAPVVEVGKIRLVRGMLKCMEIITKTAKEKGARGLVFSSTSPTLIAFMKHKYGFELAESGDSVLVFGDV